MCDVLLPPGVNPIAIKYISYHIISYKYHIMTQFCNRNVSVYEKIDIESIKTAASAI
jgi:hypothetical protein